MAQVHAVAAARDVVLWKPQGSAPAGGFPVIVFSHGFTGCATQSKFLTEALAHAGYFVIAPNHRDARCGRGGFPQPEESFGKAQDWSQATYKDRASDVRAVLDAVLAEKTFQGVPVDGERVALAGHSLGGYTVLGLAGAWPDWKDRRIKAVLALSPFCNPFVSKGDLPDLKIPVMYQGGTRDLGITPSVRRLSGAYDRSSAPKYYVELRGAGHFAWSDLNPKFQAIISEYGVAFFDQYLKKSPDRLQRMTRQPLPDLVSFLRSELK